MFTCIKWKLFCYFNAIFSFIILTFVPFDVQDPSGSIMFCGTLGHVMVPVLVMLSADCWLSFTATNASLAILFTSKNNCMDGIIRKWERERERGEAGGVGGKGRVLRDRMSKEICQIQCFSTEALTPRIITPGKPRNSPLNQVILLFFPITKAYEKLNFIVCYSIGKRL